MILWTIPAFVVLWLALSRMLFKPLLALVEEREAATTGAQQGAEELTRRAAAINAEFERKLQEARAQFIERKLATLQDARERAAQIVAAAERDAQEAVEHARKSFGAQLTSLQEQSARDIDAMVDSLVQKLLTPTTSIVARGVERQRAV